MFTKSESCASRRSRRRDCCKPARRAAVVYIGLAIAAAFGCASQSPPPVQRADAARPANRHIYVTSKSLPGECYTDLGAISITQPFGEAAVDKDNSEARKQLRTAALSRYPHDVDAVINVQSQQNDVGTEVIVTGEAIRLEDRHKVQCTLRGTEGALNQAP